MTLTKIEESVFNTPSYLVQAREGYERRNKSYIEIFFEISFNEIEIHLTKQNFDLSSKYHVAIKRIVFSLKLYTYDINIFFLNTFQ